MTAHLNRDHQRARKARTEHPCPGYSVDTYIYPRILAVRTTIMVRRKCHAAGVFYVVMQADPIANIKPNTNKEITLRSIRNPQWNWN